MLVPVVKALVLAGLMENRTATANTLIVS